MIERIVRNDEVVGLIPIWSTTSGRADNSTATVWLPARGPGAINEGGETIDRAQGVRFLRRDGGEAFYALDSGQLLS